MNVDYITEYVVTIAPAVTAAATCIAALFVGVSKVKKAFDKTDASSVELRNDVRKMKEEMAKENIELKRENRELKRENAMIKKKLHRVRFVETEGEPGDGDE